MDMAREWTDKELATMESHIRQIYLQAQSEITARWNVYMQNGQKRLDDLYRSYLSAPADKKGEALKRYQDAAKNYTLKNKWYKDMVDETSYRLAHTNEIALDYINGRIPAIYVENFNYITPEAYLVKSNWTMVNEQTVLNLMRDSLPVKNLNYAKDMAWNTKKMNSAVLQGILQGESMDKIAKRILPIVNNNQVSALRAARTMVTGAENRGRLDRFQDYEDEGVVMTKVWMATPDGRTRDWHLDMDGQEVPVNEPFIDGLGNELEYPGDPGAPAETVYNCRCAMTSHVTGIRQRDGSVRRISDYGTSALHDAQIMAERVRRVTE